MFKFPELVETSPYTVTVAQVADASELFCQCMYVSDFFEAMHPNREVIAALNWISGGGKPEDDPRSDEEAFRGMFEPWKHMGIDTAKDLDLFLGEVRADFMKWNLKLKEFERSLISSFAQIQAHHNAL